MEDLAQIAIEAALKTGARFADVRIENTATTIIELNDGVSKQSISSRLKGAGIRAFIDGAWAFAQTTDLTNSGMRATGKSVAKMALATKEKVVDIFDIDGPSFKDRSYYSVKKPFDRVSIDEKMAFLQRVLSTGIFGQSSILLIPSVQTSMFKIPFHESSLLQQQKKESIGNVLTSHWVYEADTKLWMQKRHRT
jgi:hypothetical protein